MQTFFLQALPDPFGLIIHRLPQCIRIGEHVSSMRLVYRSRDTWPTEFDGFLKAGECALNSQVTGILATMWHSDMDDALYRGN